jgi:5-methylcytosine-specific restriction protein A
MAAWPYSTARWQRLRHAQLCAHPFCEGCKPHRMTIANHVDHRVAISAGGDAFPPIGDGLASYCAGCHSAKTARGAEAGAIKSDRPRKGCDANGMPLDPSHPWAGVSMKLQEPTRQGPAPSHKTQLVVREVRSGARGDRICPTTTAKRRSNRIAPNSGKNRG